MSDPLASDILGAEAQTPGSEAVAEELLELRLEERRDAVRESRDLLLVDVDPDDVVPEGGHRGGVDGTEVPASDH